MIKNKIHFRGTTLTLFLALSSLMWSCAKDRPDNPGGGEKTNYALPYWTLGQGNKNMPNSGMIRTDVSDSPATNGVDKLVDGSLDTYFDTPHSSFTLTWNGNSNVTVKGYTISSSSDAKEYDPSAWVLEGSGNGTSWTTLDTREGIQFASRKEVKKFQFNNSAEYRYYRLRILKNNGGKSTKISEWTLSALTFKGNIDDLLKFSTGFTKSDKTPLGTIHENDKSATADQVEWLKNPAKQPTTFAGASWKGFPITTSIYPYGEPKPADVNQRKVGDCSLCAVSASLAYLFPDFIKSIIKDNGNQTYLVKLYDPMGKAIEVGVDNTFIIDNDGKSLGATAGKQGQVTWATILQKAVIKWMEVFKGNSDITGVGSEYAASIITGSGDSFAFQPGVLYPQDLQRAAMTSLENRKIVIGGFAEKDVVAEGIKKTTTLHAFTFVPPKSDKYLFGMRNPWGFAAGENSATAKDDGVIYISDDGRIPPMIDLRIIDPGAARGFARAGRLEPYIPPIF